VAPWPLGCTKVPRNGTVDRYHSYRRPSAASNVSPKSTFFVGSGEGNRLTSLPYCLESFPFWAAHSIRGTVFPVPSTVKREPVAVGRWRLERARDFPDNEDHARAAFLFGWKDLKMYSPAKCSNAVEPSVRGSVSEITLCLTKSLAGWICDSEHRRMVLGPSWGRLDDSWVTRKVTRTSPPTATWGWLPQRRA